LVGRSARGCACVVASILDRGEETGVGYRGVWRSWSNLSWGLVFTRSADGKIREIQCGSDKKKKRAAWRVGAGG
jgi:hypothetical protein